MLPCFFALLLALLVPASRAAVSVQTSLDRPSVMAGETAALRISVEGGTPQSAESFPPMAGLAIQYQGHQQQYVSVNGVSTSRHILTYVISPAQPGQFQIPAIKVVVDGANYTTQPVSLTVTKNDSPAQNRNAFLRLIAPKNEVYAGEIMAIDVQLYVTDAGNIQAPQLKSDGFIIHKQAPHTSSRTQLGQEIYNVISFKMSVSAAKTGKLALGPAEMSLVLNVRMQRDPNDVFGIFGRVQRRQVTVVSPAVEMNVLPLPADAPPEFSGAIGSFTWKVDANPKTLSAGDPITLRAVFSGNGNLDNLKLPEFKWPDFKFYEPNSSIQSTDPLGLEGTKTFEQVVIPQSTSVREIPALSVAYFDPAQKAFVDLSQPPTPLSVQPSTASAAIPTVARTENRTDEEPAEPTDIVHIKLETGAMAAIAPPLVNRPWFWVLQLAPIAAYGAFTFWRKKLDRLANSPRLRRKLRVQKTVQHGLKELPGLAAAKNTNEFYVLVFRILQEQLGERLDLPASAITEAVIDERLPGSGASPDLIERLHGLFRRCNQARYAPVQTNDELLAIVADLEKAIGELQRLPE